MSHKIGLHWIRVHPDNDDYRHIEAMQYPSAKLFEWHWSDRGACANLLSVLPKNAYLLARDHPLSEQEIWGDPVGIGQRHADEWAAKVRSGNVYLPPDRTFFLGRNEPDATAGDRAAIDRYTVAFLTRLRAHGLRGGAFNFATGHPRTLDGTPHSDPDYSVFEASHQAIVRGHHIAVAHIYGTAEFPCAPGHYDRLRYCKWTDVEWIIGEFGIDQHVIGGGEHDGYLVPYGGQPEDYCAWLDRAIACIADPRIHSYQVFTYDFSHPWDSFDVRVVRRYLERYPWTHAITPPSTPISVYIPTVSTLCAPGAAGGAEDYGGPGSAQTEPQPPQPNSLAHPIADPRLRTLSQGWMANPPDYAAFGVKGHTGIDYAVPAGTPVRAVDAGVVVEALEDPGSWGKYVKLSHAWGQSLLAHLSRQDVVYGQSVARGQIIGLSGNTGNSTGPHLHLGIRLNPIVRGADDPTGMDGWTNPLPYLESAPADGRDIWAIVQTAAEEFGVDPYLLASLVWAESRFDAKAMSPASAMGLAQITPPTWAEWSARVGESDPYDALANLRVGAAYLRWCLDQTGGDRLKALVAYNWGIKNVLDGKETPLPTRIYAYSVIHGAELLRAVN